MQPLTDVNRPLKCNRDCYTLLAFLRGLIRIGRKCCMGLGLSRSVTSDTFRHMTDQFSRRGCDSSEIAKCAQTRWEINHYVETSSLIALCACIRLGAGGLQFSFDVHGVHLSFRLGTGGLQFSFDVHGVHLSTKKVVQDRW